MDAGAIFLQYGPLGACVVVLAGVVWRLYSANAQIQNTRVAEAQAVTAKLLEVSEKWLAMLASQSGEIEKTTERCGAINERVGEVLTAVQQLDRDVQKGLKSP